jgi:hypothetical protein
MKHLFVFPVWLLLFILSLTLGAIMYLWKFSKEDFKKGSQFINHKLIKFTEWYDF